jgi:hypothetical protein
VQLDLVVGKLEADALVLADQLAEGVAAARVVDGDVVRPARRAQPAHAVREPRRAEAHLGVAQALAELAEHRAARHAHALELDHRMAAGRHRVDRVELAHDPKARCVDIHQEHASADVVARRHRRFAP